MVFGLTTCQAVTVSHYYHGLTSVISVCIVVKWTVGMTKNVSN